MTLCIVVADGARPETLYGAMDAGLLPALARVREQGSAHTVTTVFPSVTGSAYAPFLMGLHPGRAGLPGLRWYDRSRRDTLWPAHARSYVGIGGMRADKDLTRAYPTLFELEPRSLGGFTYIGRGLDARRRIGTGAAFAARMAWTHFRGDLAGWMRFDRWLGEEFVRRVRNQRPRVAFLAHPGLDKLSHRFGQEHPRVLEALKTVDATVADLHREAERGGWARELEIWVVSDHGHEAVDAHEDLELRIQELGYSTRSHPNVLKGRDIGVMVSGNCMAHLYLDLDFRWKGGWDALRGRFGPLIEHLGSLDAIDLVLLPRSDRSCEVVSRSGGRARVLLSRVGSASSSGSAAVDPHDATARISYEPETGDPLGLGEAIRELDPVAAWERCFESPYPDALVQTLAIANAPRAGDAIISAAEGWDLRSRWEPSLHVSGHGALRRRQMLVPLLMSRPVRGTPRRTTDVLPSALAALGLEAPTELDGVSFR